MNGGYNRQTDIHKQTNRKIDRQMDRQTYKQTDRKTDRKTDRYTDRQTDRHNYRPHLRRCCPFFHSWHMTSATEDDKRKIERTREKLKIRQSNNMERVEQGKKIER